MNYSWFILLLGLMTAVYYGRIEYWVTVAIILLTKIIYDMDIFTKTEFKNGNIQECRLYSKQFLGALSGVEKEIHSFKDLISKYGLSKRIYKVFALYTNQGDSPLNSSLKNVSLGIMKYKKSGFGEIEVPSNTIEKEKDLEEYLFNHQYNMIDIPRTRSIWVNFRLRSDFSLISAMKKFYSKLKEKINKKELVEVQSNMERYRTFIILEIYTDDEINFHLPLENLEKFYT